MPALRRRPRSLPEKDARDLRWLDLFGHLIGNTDRHFGNVSFLIDERGGLRLAPAYDMLPMALAPSGDELVARTPEVDPPGVANLDVWPDAARWATRYWQAVGAEPTLETAVRAYADAAEAAIARIAARVAPAE